MAIAEEMLFERLCKIDPTIPDALLKHRHRLDIEDYDRFEHVLKTEDSSNLQEWRKAIFCVFDAKLLDLQVDLERHHLIYHQKQNVDVFPVCIYITFIS